MKWIKSYPFWICVIIASLSWFVFYLSKPIDFSIKVGVNYDNLPNGYVITKGQNKKILIAFNLKGNEVNDVKKHFQNLSLTIDLDDINFKNVDDKLFYTFSPSSYIKNQIQSFQKSNVRFDILTDSITIVLEEAVTKKVPVVDGFEYYLPAGFMVLNNSGFNIDSVTIIGLATNIKNIDSLILGNKKLGYVYKNTSINVYPEKEYKNIKVVPNVLQYDINLDLYTENKIEIPIRSSDSINMMFFPDQISVKYNVSINEFNKVNSTMFKYRIDFIDNSNKAFIYLTDYPDYIELVDYYPINVEYYIIADKL